jgi:hypothetical protein
VVGWLGLLRLLRLLGLLGLLRLLSLLGFGYSSAFSITFYRLVWLWVVCCSVLLFDGFNLWAVKLFGIVCNGCADWGIVFLVVVFIDHL